MTTDALTFLLSKGFQHADETVCAAHFGNNEYKGVLKNCDYLFRKVEGKFSALFTKNDKSTYTHSYTNKFQYVSLCRYEGVCVEVVLEEYMVEKNTRRAKGFLPTDELTKKGNLTCGEGIFRTIESIYEKFN